MPSGGYYPFRYYGFVIPFCLELQKLGESYGIPIKIRACDTMGYGVNFTGAAIPRSVPGIIYGLNVHAGVPSNMIVIKPSSIRPQPGCMGPAQSIVPFSVSENVPEIRRWKPWSLSMLSFGEH